MKEDSALAILKALADDTRLRIVRALQEKDMYVELLAERLALSAPTVSFHLKKLTAAGLVDARREQYYTMYSLRREIFNTTLSALLDDGSSPVSDALREEQYRRKVIRSFMPDGRCETLPAQVKKRMIIYQEIYSRFDPSRTYTEREVNAIIAEVHDDFCTVRRAFVGMGWMQREKGVYTLHPEAAAEEKQKTL